MNDCRPGKCLRHGFPHSQTHFPTRRLRLVLLEAPEHCREIMMMISFTLSSFPIEASTCRIYYTPSDNRKNICSLLRYIVFGWNNNMLCSLSPRHSYTRKTEKRLEIGFRSYDIFFFDRKAIFPNAIVRML